MPRLAEVRRLNRNTTEHYMLGCGESSTYPPIVNPQPIGSPGEPPIDDDGSRVIIGAASAAEIAPINSNIAIFIFYFSSELLKLIKQRNRAGCRPAVR